MPPVGGSGGLANEDRFEQSCRTCRFSKHRTRDDLICRRYPPVRVHVGSSSVWPTVHRTEWCGEYRRKEGT